MLIGHDTALVAGDGSRPLDGSRVISRMLFPSDAIATFKTICWLVLKWALIVFVCLILHSGI